MTIVEPTELQRELTLQAHRAVYAIDPHALHVYTAQFARGRKIQATGEVERPPIRRGNEIIIQGMLVPNVTDTLVSSGMVFTAYSEILRALDEVRNEGLNPVILHITSGGGILAGLWDVLERIALMREAGTRFIALVDQLAASAAYMLAAETDRIVATVTSELGSVGVYSILTSWSEALESSGVRNVVIASGELKAKGNALKAITDQDIESERRLIDSLFSIMRDRLQSRRSMLDMTRVSTGDLFLAPESQTIGLVDEVIPSLLAFNIEPFKEQEQNEQEQEQEEPQEENEPNEASTISASVHQEETNHAAMNTSPLSSKEQIIARLLRAGASRSLILSILEDRDGDDKLALFAEVNQSCDHDPRDMLKRYYAQYREDYQRAHTALKQRR